MTDEDGQDWPGEWTKVNGIDVWVGSSPDQPELEELLREPPQRREVYPTDPRECDQAFPTKPPVQYQLEQLRTHLHWIVEHAMTLAAEGHDADEVENILDSGRQAEGHLSRLVQLLDPPRDPAGPVK